VYGSKAARAEPEEVGGIEVTAGGNSRLPLELYGWFK